MSGKSFDEHRWKQVRKYGSISAVSVLLVIACILFVRILLAPVELGAPSTESELVVRSNERLLDMAKWTISTILTIGGALIGLNWYQSAQRHEQDKEALDRMRGENDDRMQRWEKYLEQQLGEMRDYSSVLEHQLLETVSASIDSRIEEQFQRIATSSSQDDDETSGASSQTNLGTGQKGGWSSFWENITNQQTGPPLVAQSKRFTTPNPFRDMRQERELALESIESALRMAAQTAATPDELIQMGATEVWKILPSAAVDFPDLANDIRSLLVGLAVPKPKPNDQTQAPQAGN